ncbi:MAG: DUF305 domain-containing protein [Cyclobacteriaceae bacterium]|nr:DUF305 domain-containing protein [Cyclobacteriaceae bacterium]
MKHESHTQHSSHGNGSMYRKLALMMVLSFIAMYILMYAMVDKFSNVIVNVNQFYMAGLMAMAMLVIELAVMWSMYAKRKLNLVLLVLGIIGLTAFYVCIREQAAVGDKQFLKSMIPHHAAAILMVEETPLTDPEIRELASKIITSQQAEIEQMKAKLKELESK